MDLAGRERSYFFNGYTLFLAVFLCHALRIFQGLCVTDAGHHFAHQVAAFRSRTDPDSVSALVFLTDFVGGMWLWLRGTPSVIWARLGGILFYGVNAVLAYKVLSVYFPRRRTFVVVLISAFFVTMRDPMNIIHYFSFPGFLVTVELLILNKAMTAWPRDRTFGLWSFLLGFMVVPIVLSRFTLIFIVAAPVLVLGFALVTRCGTGAIRKSSPYVLGGFLVSAAVFAALYQSLGFLLPYLGTTRAIVGRSATHSIPGGYGMGQLVRVYLREYAWIGVYTAGAGVGLYVASFARRWLRVRWADIAFFAAALVGFGAAAKLIGVGTIAWDVVKLSIGAVLAVSGLFLICDRGRNRRLSVLVLVSSFIMVITPVGSNTGVVKTPAGMWVALPLALLIVTRLRDQVSNKRLRAMLSFDTVAVATMLVVAGAFHFIWAYKDVRNRFKLTAGFQHPSLRFIYSHKERVRIVDEVLAEIESRTKAGDEVVMANSIPLFYYLTQTRPLLGHPWLLCAGLDGAKARCEKALKEGRYPKLLVYSKINTKSNEWPSRKGTDVLPENIKPILAYLTRTYVDRHGYKLDWENAAFAIYVSPANPAKGHHAETDQ